MNLNSTFMLNNGIKIPLLGLGVFKNPTGKSTQNAVLAALKNGYRHIDTAKIYANEQDVGIAIKNSEIPRDEIFVTTKLWNGDQGYDSTLRALDESLQKLQLDYVDLYLMHWPVEKLRLESWRAMEKLLNDGKALSIGISNFMKRHVDEILNGGKIIPAVNQIELSPYIYQFRKDTIDFCLENNILIEAYSPLTKGRKLNDPRLVEISNTYGKSTAQILIRWVLEHKFIVIPKSSKEERIIENANVFDFSISKEDMAFLDSLNENLVTGWDPTTAP